MRWIIGMGIIIVNVYCVVVFRLFLNFDCFDDIEWLVLCAKSDKTKIEPKKSRKNRFPQQKKSVKT